MPPRCCLRGGLNQLPVIDHGEPVGVITRSDVATALAHAGPTRPSPSAPQHDVVMVSPGDSLDSVLDRLREEPDSVALVIDHGLPVGVLTAEHLADVRRAALAARRVDHALCPRPCAARRRSTAQPCW